MENKFYIFLSYTIISHSRGFWRRVKKRFWQIARRIQVQFVSTGKDLPILRGTLVEKIPNEAALIQHIITRPDFFFFIDDQKKEETVKQFRDLFPNEEKKIILAANQICQHKFDLLGSGFQFVGGEIDWQKDFKTGHRWNEKSFFTDLHHAPFPGGYDIKVPWELSRCQHFIWLGQAYWFSGDEIYIHEFCSQVESWIENNPPQFGVNWVCTMDVSIRAINWLWGYAYFRHSPVLSDSFHINFYKALLAHGRHIFHNLEYSERLTSNHYLSNIVGLVFLGILLPELKEAKQWVELGIRELEAEMLKQVYPDGVDFEASTNYHRLANELFLSATMLAQKNGYVFSNNYLSRLQRMIEVTGNLLRPDGTVPIVGDQDNGRLHRLMIWEDPFSEWNNFRPLFAVGAIWLNKPVSDCFDNSDWIEAFWLCGFKTIQQFQNLQQSSTKIPEGSVLFPDGGWVLIRDSNHYLMLDSGPVGQNNQGGHSHNDSLSVDVYANGQAWIVDPGTFTYTSDYKLRNTFRQTKSHNTVYISGHEQNIIRAESPFRVESSSKSRIIHWETDDQITFIAAEVEFAKPDNIIHRRAILYSSKSKGWLIADSIYPNGIDAKIHLSFSSGIQAIEIDSPTSGIKLTNKKGQSFFIFNLQNTRPQIGKCWVSRSYGIKEDAYQAEFVFSSNALQYWTLLSEEDNFDLDIRNQNLINAWNQLSYTHYLK
jgi:hypothetical protein